MPLNFPTAAAVERTEQAETGAYAERREQLNGGCGFSGSTDRGGDRCADWYGLTRHHFGSASHIQISSRRRAPRLSAPNSSASMVASRETCDAAEHHHWIQGSMRGRRTRN